MQKESEGLGFKKNSVKRRGNPFRMKSSRGDSGKENFIWVSTEADNITREQRKPFRRKTTVSHMKRFPRGRRKNSEEYGEMVLNIMATKRVMYVCDSFARGHLRRSMKTLTLLHDQQLQSVP